MSAPSYSVSPMWILPSCDITNGPHYMWATDFGSFSLQICGSNNTVFFMDYSPCCILRQKKHQDTLVISFPRFLSEFLLFLDCTSTLLSWALFCPPILNFGFHTLSNHRSLNIAVFSKNCIYLLQDTITFASSSTFILSCFCHSACP